MNMQLLITALGFIAAATVGYKYYIKVSNATGMGTLSKVSLGTRMVISAFSVALSIYGVHSFTYSFLHEQNGASEIVAVSVATIAGVLAGLAMEMLLVSSEKALYESWFYGLNKFIGIALVVLIGQYANYETMAFNADSFISKAVAKETKVIDSVVLNTSKDAVAVNNNTIASLREQLKNTKTDYKVFLSNNYTKTISNIKRYSKDENKYRSLLAKLRANKELLESRAKARANKAERIRKANLRKEISTLVATNISLSKSTLESREKKIKSATNIAEIRAETLKSLALGIVLFSVFLSIISSMTSDSLNEAKRNALAQKIEDIKAANEMASVEVELANAQEKLKVIKSGITPQAPTNAPAMVDQQTEVVNQPQTEAINQQAEVGFDGGIREVVSFATPATKKAVEQDFNEILYSLARSFSNSNKHPSRKAMLDLARAQGLDVKNWTAKYKAYCDAMRYKGKLKDSTDAKGLEFVMESKNEAVA